MTTLKTMATMTTLKQDDNDLYSAVIITQLLQDYFTLLYITLHETMGRMTFLDEMAPPAALHSARRPMAAYKF